MIRASLFIALVLFSSIFPSIGQACISSFEVSSEKLDLGSFFSSPFSVQSKNQNTEFLQNLSQNLDKIYSQVSQESYYEFCQYLSGVIGSRAYFEPTNAQTLAWLQDILKNMSSRFEFTIYPQHNSLIAKLPRTLNISDLQILVGAHFDTVLNTNGTDDNASGVSAVLEVARVLSNYSWSCDLLFAFFNEEENGRYGSQEIAEDLMNKGRPLRVFTLDMILWKQETGLQQIIYDDRMNEVRSKFFGLLMQNFSLDYSQRGLTLTPRQGSFRWDLSDHGRFWDLGFPTILITEEQPFENPYYHRPTDVITNTDYDFEGAGNLTAILATVVSYLAFTSADTDMDGLTWAEEKYLKTDSLSNDTDNDNVSDLDEILGGTDPLNNDTNGNGILDGDEKQIMSKYNETLYILVIRVVFVGILIVSFFMGVLIFRRFKKKHS